MNYHQLHVWPSGWSGWQLRWKLGLGSLRERTESQVES